MVDKYIQGLIDREPADSSIKYQFLSRMKTECEYITGSFGPKHRIEDNLWADNASNQIDNMKALWNSFSDEGKPEWLSMEQIDKYEKQLNDIVMADKSKTEPERGGL